jgi:hypothetical protein
LPRWPIRIAGLAAALLGSLTIFALFEILIFYLVASVFERIMGPGDEAVVWRAFAAAFTGAPFAVLLGLGVGSLIYQRTTALLTEKTTL